MTIEQIVTDYEARRGTQGDELAWQWFKGAIKEHEAGISGMQPLVHDINDFDRMLARRVEYIPIGYPALDKYVHLPCGDRPVVVAGLSSHGKTSFMLDMLDNLVRTRAQDKFLFLPYEATWGKTAMRYLYMRWAKDQMGADFYSMLMSFKDFWKSAQYETPIREYCRTQYAALCQRVMFRDGNFTAEQLALVMRRYVEHCPEIKGIFVDYLQIMPVFESDIARQVRQAQLKYIMDVARAISQDHGIFVVLGSQITEPEYGRNKRDILKPKHLREAKDIYYSASVVIGLWNETKFRADNESADIENTLQHNVEIDIIKNADGTGKRGVKFNFFAPYGFFVEAAQ